MNVCLGFVISHHMSKTSCDEYRISVSGSLFKANLGLADLQRRVKIP